MDGWSYLGGRRWQDVTRDERFFCQRLFALASEDVPAFVRQLNALSPSLALNAEADWEVGYEVCFFRDVWHLRSREGSSGLPDWYSPKRTFDLCLFSEDRVVIIEAKAQQSFSADPQQWANFKDEPDLVRQALGRPDLAVSLLTIAASECLTPEFRLAARDAFGVEPVGWSDLSKAYGDDPVLARANSVFERPSSGVNNERYRSGEELLAASIAGKQWLVGRQGGVAGKPLQQDVDSGAWRTRLYETRDAAGSVPNGNWFALAEFARLVGAPRGLLQS